MFIKELKAGFEALRNSDNAAHMKAYMRNQFEFYGIKAGMRREVFHRVISENKQEVSDNCRNLVRELYDNHFREMHLCAMELLYRIHGKSLSPGDIELITYLISTHSWWDTVDYIAKNLLGQYLKIYPEKKGEVIEAYASSDDLWLNRSAILFQLGYKNNTDADLLFSLCERFSGSGEFFIQKAIGWSLREYGKNAPDAVLNFVNSHSLKPLSRREAIRNL